MQREPVTSSMIKSVGYDEAERKLEIEFSRGGIYQYEDVPSEIFENLFSAPSAGKYFDAKIKGAFTAKKIN